MGEARGIAPGCRAVFFDGEFDRDCNLRSPGPIISQVQARSSWSGHRLSRYFLFAGFAVEADGFGAGCDGSWAFSTLRNNTVNEARACAPASLSGLTTTATLVFAMPNVTTKRLCFRRFANSPANRKRGQSPLAATQRGATRRTAPLPVG